MLVEEVAGGLIPNIPTGSVVIITGLMGWVGAGTTTLLYSTWIKEKIGVTGAPSILTYTTYTK